MRLDVDGDGADVGDDVDDDLDDARDDDDDDGDDLPGGICPPEMAFLLCRFPPRGGGETRKLLSLGVSPQGGLIGERGHRGGPPGIQEGAWRGQEGGRARHPSGCLVGPLTSIFGDPQSIFTKLLPVNFHRIWT